MSDIFKKHNRKKQLRDKFYLYLFYTVFLYLFALLIVAVGKSTQICIAGFCAHTQSALFFPAFILYIYFLLLVLVLVYTYKLLEKLVARKNHIRYFKYIFWGIPLFTALLVWLLQIDWNDALLVLVFASIISVLGLLMIAFRKK